MKTLVIAIHGGAGTILKKKMTPEMEEAYLSKLKESLEVGYRLLADGHTSVEAVEASVQILEDSPLFNAGKGSVFNSDGDNEMDAAIMEGATLKAGAVAGLRKVKNPVSAAKAIMEQSKHVLMIGKGAEKFVAKLGIPMESAAYFFDQMRWDQLQKLKGTENQQLDHFDDKKYGTVGAVALDKYGNLAAASSTGGLTNKKPGRVGDSPIIGAGTYANNRTCAVAATGEGEYFIRAVLAHDISAMMEYKGYTLEQAVQEAIHEKMTGLGGKGGVIAVDTQGNISMAFNTRGMYRGSISKEGNLEVLIYR